MIRIWAMMTAAMLLAAAMLFPSSAVARDDGLPCATMAPHYLDFSPILARQGTTIQLLPHRGMPYEMQLEPAKCMRRWKLSNPKLARLGPKQTLVIAADATPDAMLTVSYQVRDGGKWHPVKADLRIVARDAKVLTGIRSQKAIEGCTGMDKVGEIEFRADGSFAVTYQPFESYRDYWGSFTYDPATGALAMTVTGGNFTPGNLDLTGTATLDGNALTLSGFALGSHAGQPAPAGGCTYRF